ncbi:MAG: NosD domain-containing protein [Candidatus Lokiarchaeota archaeon]
MIGIIVVPSVCITNSYRSSEKKEDFNVNNKNLNVSKLSNRIHIINNSGWVEFRNAGNCTGSGNFSNPYIIEDLVIDGKNSGSCIWIENSNVYFKIENCTLYNSTIDSSYAGIKLDYVNNSKLINNNISSIFRGITINHGNNNSVIENYVSNTNDAGIYIRFSGDNLINENNVTNTIHYGIYLYRSNKNFILGNIVTDVDRGESTDAQDHHGGIFLVKCNENLISGNTAISNWENGIYLSSSDNNKITLNNFSHNIHGGINSYFSSYNNISQNVLSFNGLWDIYLEEGRNDFISSNIMRNSGVHLVGYSSHLDTHIIDTSNLLNGKPIYFYANKLNLIPENFSNAGQVILVKCHESKISSLNISYCDNAISLYRCTNIMLSENTANNNLNGIYLYYSNYNNITGNIVQFNEDAGISIIFSYGNIVARNTVNSNYLWGIQIGESTDNTIRDNNVYNNILGINIDSNSDNSIVSKNLLDYNTVGIGIYNSDNNNITENKVFRSKHIGIDLYFSRNNFIEGNEVKQDRIGINVEGSSSENNFSNNIINSNYDYGLFLSKSNSNEISDNRISDNGYGIYVIDSSNSLIYLNCFTKNNVHALDNGSNNMWDNGVFGNYWDDYNGTDSNNDGIGNLPYNIPGSAKSKDRFPLMSCAVPTLHQSISGYNIFFLIGIIIVLSFSAIVIKKKRLL